MEHNEAQVESLETEKSLHLGIWVWLQNISKVTQIGGSLKPSVISDYTSQQVGLSHFLIFENTKSQSLDTLPDNLSSNDYYTYDSPMRQISPWVNTILCKI